MAFPKLDPDQELEIEKIVRKWKGKLTWTLLVKTIEVEMGISITRQTLSSYSSILSAFKYKKAELRGVTPEVYVNISEQDLRMVERLEDIKAENLVLKRKLSEQLKMLERIFANASEIPNLDLSELIRERPDELY